ncbi:MAG: hypothetical protein R6U52_06125 [Kosmotogaceae bacterium]
MKKFMFGLLIGVLALFFLSCTIPIKIPGELVFDFEFEPEDMALEFVPTSGSETSEVELTPIEIENPLADEEIPFDAKIKKIEFTVTATVTSPEYFEEFEYEIYINKSNYSTDVSDLAIRGTMKPGVTTKTVDSEEYGGIDNLKEFLASDEEEATFYAVIKHNYSFETDETAKGQIGIQGTVYVGY